MKNHRAVYRFLIASLCATYVVVIFIAYYVVGLIELSSISSVVEDRVATIALIIEEKNQEIQTVVSQFSEDNISKAKALSFMIHQYVGGVIDSESIEEIRVALHVEELVITDDKGNVTAGTSAYIGQNISDNSVYSRFIPIIEDRSITSVVNIEKDGVISQYAGVARTDASGIVIVKTSASYLSQTVRLSDISTVADDFPILKEGKSAIIDIDSWTFLSHTDKKFVNISVQIPKSEFSELNTEDTGSFKILYDNVKSYVFYKEYNGRIIALFIPEEEVFSHRNYVVFGMTFGILTVSVTAILAVRSKLIWMEEASRRVVDEGSD